MDVNWTILHDGLSVPILLLLAITPVSPVQMLTRGGVFVMDAGDSISLDCAFHESDYDLFRCPVLWKKSQHNEETQINIMGNINDPFLDTDRYRVELVETPPKYTLELHIKDLAQEDSGNYTCEVRGPHSVVLQSVIHSLYVRAPVEHIFITSSRNLSELAPEYKTPSVLSFIEDEPATIRCIVIGGYPPPSIDLMVAKTRVTSQFNFQNGARLLGERGLKVMSFSSERWTTNYIPKAHEDGRRLRCVVKVSGFKAQNENVKLSVDYQPRINCVNQQASVGDENVRMLCTVAAKPEPTHFWILDANETTLRPGDVVNEFWTTSQELQGGILQVILHQRKIRPNNFRRYKLVAENSVGLSVGEVVLQRKHSSLRDQSTDTPSDDEIDIGIGRSASKDQHSPLYGMNSDAAVANNNTQPFHILLTSILWMYILLQWT